MTGALLDLLIRLGERSARAEVAAELARQIGVERFLLLVDDPALGVLLPAPGFAQTLDGGVAWRRFLVACKAPGRRHAGVDLPRGGGERDALAIRYGALVAVLIGGAPDTAGLDTVERLLPLLDALLQAEQAALLALAQAAEDRAAAGRAHALASALESARAEASRLNAQLAEADRRKDEFLAMLAHELRNPLAPMVMALDMLRRPVVAVEARERQLAMLMRQVHQMSRLVEDLLDVSRVSHGRIELRRQRLSLRQVVGEAVESSRPLLVERRHQLTVVDSLEALEIDGDAVRLTQVLTNLLHNAAKFTDPGGTLVMRTTRDGDEAVISLQDSGVGIAADMLPRIFDLFTQVPVSIDRSRGGLGIGLTLVRSLVELHGGHVAVTSGGLGKGSTFSIRLPLAAHAEGTPQAPAIAAQGVAQDAMQGAAPGGLRVLVVDDNEDAADSVAEMLRMDGHDAVAVYRGESALALAAGYGADLILLDLGLPGIDGYEVARRLRPIVGQGTRLVALTGYGSEADRRKSRAAGFDDHLVKPVLGETLDALTASIVAARHAPVAG